MTAANITATTSDTPRSKVLLLCAGTFPSSEKGKQVTGFYRVANLKTPSHDTHIRYYDAKNVKKAVGTPRAGYVYEVEAPDEKADTIYTGTMSFKCSWPNEQVRVDLAAQDLARSRVLAAQKATKAAASTDPLFEALEPVRRAYSRSVGANRVQLLATIVQYITAGER
jgi:hypothetical protein